MNKILRLILVTGWGMGIGAQRVSARVSASRGVIRNKIGEAVVGRTGSLINSFKPSAIGWSKP